MLHIILISQLQKAAPSDLTVSVVEAGFAPEQTGSWFAVVPLHTAWLSTVWGCRLSLMDVRLLVFWLLHNTEMFSLFILLYVFT